MQRLEEILPTQRPRILELARQHGARNVRIFGSVSRGESRPKSDLDLLVEMEEGRSLLDRVALAQDLEDLLGHKVDVVNERALHWFVRDRILAEATEL